MGPFPSLLSRTLIKPRSLIRFESILKSILEVVLKVNSTIPGLANPHVILHSFPDQTLRLIGIPQVEPVQCNETLCNT
jgi:hypothetical protein